MILLIDNYDSFVFNLYQALAVFGPEIQVVRNDVISVEEALAMKPNAVVISPGPGRPSGAGIVLDLLAALPDTMPVLGVCLGHQAIVESEGGVLEVDAVPVHGKTSDVQHDRTGLFADQESPMKCGRYHSLRALRTSLPSTVRVTAETEDGTVMGIEHRTKPRFGVQFHPESILTPLGAQLLGRFLEIAGLMPAGRMAEVQS